MIAKVEQGMRRMGELEAYIPSHPRPALGRSGRSGPRGHGRHGAPAATLRRAAGPGGPWGERTALILVVEDLHCNDASSEEFLTFILDEVAGLPLMLLVTYRIGYTPPFWEPQLFYNAHAAPLLRGRDAGNGGLCPWHGAVSRRTPDRSSMAKAEGVPLFIEEVIQALLDLGVLQRAPGTLPSGAKSSARCMSLTPCRGS